MDDNFLKKIETLGNEQLVKTLNQTLELENADRIQYLAHAKLVKKVSKQRRLLRTKTMD
jgi:bacterioferritin (cytochrome b1)